jgi:AbrB family looped-hinge helix DNA binding protein
MITTIDSAGRLVIPRDIRREAGLKPGMPLSVAWRNGTVEIQPASLPVKLVRRGRLTIAIPESDVSVLTGEAVERTRGQLRKQRAH